MAKSDIDRSRRSSGCTATFKTLQAFGEVIASLG